MGTRNLTMVFMDGEYKVAQYGQWDGYPEGQGMTCLKFLREQMYEAEFREQVKRVHFIGEEESKALFAAFGADADGPISFADYNRMSQMYPELHRDTGAEILQMIQEGSVHFLSDDLSFAADGLFCEWAYVIDLDKRMFEVYEGFHKEPVTEQDRFYFLKDKADKDYPCVRLVHAWSLDDLPTEEEFLAAFRTKEDEE